LFPSFLPLCILPFLLVSHQYPTSIISLSGSETFLRYLKQFHQEQPSECISEGTKNCHRCLWFFYESVLTADENEVFWPMEYSASFQTYFRGEAVMPKYHPWKEMRFIRITQVLSCRLLLVRFENDNMDSTWSKNLLEVRSITEIMKITRILILPGSNWNSLAVTMFQTCHRVTGVRIASSNIPQSIRCWDILSLSVEKNHSFRVVSVLGVSNTRVILWDTWGCVKVCLVKTLISCITLEILRDVSV
jgi:hypothetical protein